MFILDNLIWTEGLYLAIAVIFLSILFLFYNKFLFLIFFSLFLFFLFFFRNPERKLKNIDPNVILCPADGKIVDIKYDVEGYKVRISIFLSIFDVHVNYAPLAGVVKKIHYKPGKFLVAFLPKSSELNERNDLILEDKLGRIVKIRQIAGLLARRIVVWVKKGDCLAKGDKYGMIKFGSRVDVFLPEEAELKISLGQKVYGGKTILGMWKCLKR